MNYIEVNGTSLRYDLRGTSGPILVMIHEMGGMIENWDRVMPRFAQGFRVLRYDTRGCGLSEKVRGELSVELLSDDLLALLDALDLKEPAALAGRAMLENVLRDGMRSIVEGAMASGYPPVLRERDPERFRAFRARWLGNDPYSFVAHYRLLIDMDIAHHVKAMQCPALGIGGTLDVFRSPEYVRNIMHPIPGVEFVTIETSHHQTVETPEEIAEAIHAFLKRRVLSMAA